MRFYTVDELQKAVLATGIAVLYCLFTNGQSLVFDNHVVELTTFTAQVEKKKALLQWTTATKTNTSHFVIERGTDGVHFSDAGILFTEGNSIVAGSYQFADIDKGVPLVYYRLRIVDPNGKYNYSPVRMIRAPAVDQEAMVVVFPNPVNKELRISIPLTWQGSKVHYQVKRQDGLIVRRWSVFSASQREVTDFSQLPAGTYFITVQRDEEAFTQKVIRK